MDLVCVLALCHLVAESLHLRFVRDVGDVRGDAQALRQARRLAEPLRFRHRVRKDVTHRDIAAFGDQLADELSAHTRAAAGDDCNPACKILHMSRLPWFSASIDEKRPLASPDVASKPMALVDDFRAQSTLNPAGRHFPFGEVVHPHSSRSRQPLPKELAQLRAASRNAACRAVSIAPRNRDLSLLVNGAGPLVISPSSLRCRAISRPTSALPIFAGVQCLPVGETTRAPFWRQRDASGISDVTQTSTTEMCSAIQSSAASALSPTRIMLTFGVPGGRMGREPLDTTKTLSLRRAATRYVSSRTGHASPST